MQATRFQLGMQLKPVLHRKRKWFIGQQDNSRVLRRDFVERDARVTRVMVANDFAWVGQAQIRSKWKASFALAEHIFAARQFQHITHKSVSVRGHPWVTPNGNKYAELVSWRSC